MVLALLIEHPIVTGCFALIAAYVISVALTVLRPGLRDIPGPFWAKISRLWQIRVSLSGQWHIACREIHEKYGPIVRVGPNSISISDPTAIPIIYGSHADFLKSDMYLPFNAFVDGKPDWNLFSTPHPAQHKQIKSSVASKYQSVSSVEHLVDEVLVKFMEIMEKHAGKPFDFGDYMLWLAFDLMANISFRRTLGFLETDSDPYGITESIYAMNSYASAVGSLPEAHYLLSGNPIMSKIMSLLTTATDGVNFMLKMAKEELDRYDKAESGRGDFVEYLNQAQSKSPEKMSGHLMLQTLAGNLTAGSDTTAISLRAIFYYLIKNPRCYNKLQAEIGEAQEKGLLSEYITYNETQKHIPYLHLVIKEALRLHPPFSIHMRRLVPENAPLICGHKFPAGTEVGINPWAIHRNKSVFGQDADDFRPERWLESETGEAQLKQMETCFLAFGAGARICIGRRIAVMEIAKLVPLILRRWRVEWVGVDGSQEWKVDTQVTCRQTGMIVNLVDHVEGK